MPRIFIPVPEEFSFDLSLSFLKRSPRELLHHVNGNAVTKLIRVKEEQVLFRIRAGEKKLIVDFLGPCSDPARIHIKQFIVEWFDLETDLKPFYTMARKDPLLRSLVRKFHGYRIIGQPDLFESLVWAVLGQQINLPFAYSLKQRFVDAYGDKLHLGQQRFHLFPRAELVSRLEERDLLKFQFSRQKSRYTIGIAEAFASGKISREKLKDLSLDEAKEELMKIKGIGNWTANYGLMKTFRYPRAFPLEDAGLHNAIKNQLGLRAKPSLDQVKRMFRKYSGWEAYATLYLWRSLSN